MKAHALALLLAASAVQPALAGPATRLAEGDAHTVTAAGRTAVVYFSKAGGAFTVVSSAAGPDGSASLRTTHALADGASVVLRLASGEGPRDLVLARVGDTLEVAAPEQVAAR